MREIINDFNVMEDQPDGSIRVPLGREGRTPGLERLADGERVLIREASPRYTASCKAMASRKADAWCML